MADKLSTEDVIAFRLDAHHLNERLPEDGLLDAAGRCAIQNSPPGSALLALHARVRNLTRERMDRAIAEDKSLLQTWCMRGSPFYFPVADAPVFTTGVLPTTEGGKQYLIQGVGPTLEKLGMRLTEAVELIGAEMHDVLSGRRLAIHELGAELAGRIAPGLPKNQRAVWEEEGPHARGQPIGEAVVHFCLRILTLQGLICFAPRAGNKAPFVLVDEWLGNRIPDVAPDVARAELLRRYLRCYGPSTPRDFAAWLGIHANDVDSWWGLAQDELTEVDFGGKSWIRTEDLDTLRSAPKPAGVRMLPPRDPYTQLRDRETIVEKKYHGAVWKKVGEPGVLLAHGKIAGSWRPSKSGKKLTVNVNTFDSLPARDKDAVQEEAERVAPLRGASRVQVEFGTS